MNIKLTGEATGVGDEMTTNAAFNDKVMKKTENNHISIHQSPLRQVSDKKLVNQYNVSC